MNGENLMRERKRAGLITFIGILLIIFSPIIYILSSLFFAAIIAIFGLIILFYGSFLWKKSMHEIQVRSAALRVGEKESISEISKDKVKPSIVRISKKRTIVIGVGIGFLSTFLGAFVGMMLAGGRGFYGIRMEAMPSYLLQGYIILAAPLIGLISYSYIRSSKFGVLCAVSCVLTPSIPGFVIIVISGIYLNTSLLDWAGLFIIALMLISIAGYAGGYLARHNPFKMEVKVQLAEKESQQQKEPAMDCPSCKSPVRKNAKFCPKCGAAMTVTCPKCNNAISITSKFCPKCGEKIQILKLKK